MWHIRIPNSINFDPHLKGTNINLRPYGLHWYIINRNTNYKG